MPIMAARKGRKPNWSDVEAFLDALDQASKGLPPQYGKPLGGIASAGMVMSPKNMEKMTKAIRAAVGKGASAGEAALAFLKAKYPKLTSLPKGYELDPKRRFSYIPRVQEYLGSFDDEGKEIAKAFGVEGRQPSEVVSTLAHETTHALQKNRRPALLENYLKADQDLSGYQSQLAEVQARQGGATAEKAFTKLLQHLSKNQPGVMDLSQPVTKEFVNEVMLPLQLKDLPTMAKHLGKEKAVELAKWKLDRAAKTARGTLGNYQSPFSFEDVLISAPYELRDQYFNPWLRQQGFANARGKHIPDVIRKSQLDLLLGK